MHPFLAVGGGDLIKLGAIEGNGRVMIVVEDDVVDCGAEILEAGAFGEVAETRGVSGSDCGKCGCGGGDDGEEGEDEDDFHLGEGVLWGSRMQVDCLIETQCVLGPAFDTDLGHMHLRAVAAALLSAGVLD